MSNRYIRKFTLWVALPILVSACGLNPRIEAKVRHATVAIQSETTASLGFQFAGTGFAIGPNEFATAAHVLDAYVGSDVDTPVVRDWQGAKHQIGVVLAYSQLQDVAVVTLDPPLEVEPLQRATSPGSNGTNLWVAGHEEKHNGTQFGYAYLKKADKEEGSDEPSDIEFSGPVWQGLSGGPLFDSTGAALGVVYFGEPIFGELNLAVPIDAAFANRGKTANIYPGALFQFLGTTHFNEPHEPVEVMLGRGFKDFTAESQGKRSELYMRNIGSHLGASEQEYSLYGEGALKECQLLNGDACTCVRPRSPDTGRSNALNAIVVEQFAPQSGPVTLDNLAGVVVIRARQPVFLRARSVSDPDFHFDLARNGYTERTFARSLHFDLAPLQAARPGELKPYKPYLDASKRTWELRVWPLQKQAHVVVSLARDLGKKGHVVLMRTVPVAAEGATIMQLEYVANFAHACP